MLNIHVVAKAHTYSVCTSLQNQSPLLHTGLMAQIMTDIGTSNHTYTLYMYVIGYNNLRIDTLRLTDLLVHLLLL